MPSPFDVSEALGTRVKVLTDAMRDKCVQLDELLMNHHEARLAVALVVDLTAAEAVRQEIAGTGVDPWQCTMRILKIDFPSRVAAARRRNLN